MIKKYREFKAFILLFVVCFAALFATGCPKEHAVKNAVDASYRLPAATNDLIARIEEGKAAGTLSAADARRFGEILNPIARAEVVFVDSVKALNSTYQQTNHFDPAVLKQLRTYLDANIIMPFLQILENARVISAGGGQVFLLAIEAVRALLLRIGSGFGSSHMKALAA